MKAVYLGGPTDIEDFLEFIEHPETHNDFQGRIVFFSQLHISPLGF